ncbi:hypothetical protein RP20_CCG024799 [Aedes albopictus]|nr:hypothetical protein RP20_CCG024799 [Aedes albopictus]
MPQSPKTIAKQEQYQSVSTPTAIKSEPTDNLCNNNNNNMGKISANGNIFNFSTSAIKEHQQQQQKKIETMWKKKKQLLIAVVEMHENKKTRTIYKQLKISDFLSTVTPPFFCCTTECACVKLK